jgi:hypothetical protein
MGLKKEKALNAGAFFYGYTAFPVEGAEIPLGAFGPLYTSVVSSQISHKNK